MLTKAIQRLLCLYIVILYQQPNQMQRFVAWQWLLASTNLLLVAARAGFLFKAWQTRSKLLLIPTQISTLFTLVRLARTLLHSPPKFRESPQLSNLIASSLIWLIPATLEVWTSLLYPTSMSYGRLLTLKFKQSRPCSQFTSETLLSAVPQTPTM